MSSGLWQGSSTLWEILSRRWLQRKSVGPKQEKERPRRKTDVWGTGQRPACPQLPAARLVNTRKTRGRPCGRGSLVANFHSPDPSLIINALRFILESYKLYRSRSGQKLPEKQEEVLEETVVKAEEMSAKGASTETVVSEIETNLERELGKAAKDEIVNRASSILALAHPFELEAFQYYENLSRMLKR